MEAKELTLVLLEKGLTQAKIAEFVGVQQSTVSKLLNGSIGDVSSKTYRALLDLNRKTRKPKAVV